MSLRYLTLCRSGKPTGLWTPKRKHEFKQGNSLLNFTKEIKTSKERKDRVPPCRTDFVSPSFIACVDLPWIFGNGPNTVSESTVSNTKLSEFFCPHRVPGENLVSSSLPIICVLKRTHRVFLRTHRVCPKTQ